MRKLLDIKKLKLYLWIGLAFLMLSLLSDAVEHSDGTYPKRALDQIWKISYLVLINSAGKDFSGRQASC